MGHYPLSELTTEALKKLRASLIYMRDPASKGLFRMISAEIKIRKRPLPIVELASLAKRGPMVGNAEKEPAMNKNVWYAAKDDEVRFANNQNSLTSQGFTNPQSFTVNGDISGLNLIDDNATGAQASSTQQPQG